MRLDVFCFCVVRICGVNCEGVVVLKEPLVGL